MAAEETLLDEVCEVAERNVVPSTLGTVETSCSPSHPTSASLFSRLISEASRPSSQAANPDRSIPSENAAAPRWRGRPTG
jgi:hypothetical protein